MGLFNNAGKKKRSIICKFVRSRSFLNLECNNYTSKIIPKIQKQNGETITEQTNILAETKNFYQDLFNDKTMSIEAVCRTILKVKRT